MKKKKRQFPHAPIWFLCPIEKSHDSWMNMWTWHIKWTWIWTRKKNQQQKKKKKIEPNPQKIKHLKATSKEKKHSYTKKKKQQQFKSRSWSEDTARVIIMHASLVCIEEDPIYRAGFIEPELLHVAGLGVISICNLQLLLCHLDHNSNPEPQKKLRITRSKARELSQNAKSK